MARWAAQQGMALTMHWPRGASAGQLLDLFERVNPEVPIADLRWSIAHLNDASAENLGRMKALGVGRTVQEAMDFGGDQFLQQEGTKPRAERRLWRRHAKSGSPWAPARMRTAWLLTIPSPRSNGFWTAKRSPARRSAGPKKRRP